MICCGYRGWVGVGQHLRPRSECFGFRVFGSYALLGGLRDRTPVQFGFLVMPSLQGSIASTPAAVKPKLAESCTKANPRLPVSGLVASSNSSWLAVPVSAASSLHRGITA